LIPDFLILGGGIVGLATAWELSGRGAQVAVLDRSQPGRESSWAGAGILSLLLPWDYGQAVTDLAEASQARYGAWIDGIMTSASTDPEYRQTGMLVLPPHDRQRALSHLSRHGQGPMCPPARIQMALPSVGEALWLAEVAQVRNPRLIRALAEALASRGVQVHAGVTVEGLDELAGQVTTIRANGRLWRAGAFVVAAGAWSAPLLGPATQSLPIRPVRGQMLLYKSAPDRLPCIVYQDGHYLVPRADGHILAGSTLEETGYDKGTTAAARQALHAFANDLLPDIATPGPVQHWSGLRPGSPGNVPIICRHPELTNLYVNAGHYRYGVTMAPASAELLADLALDRQPKLAASPYAWPVSPASAAPAS
jgi:glycine oxidase